MILAACGAPTSASAPVTKAPVATEVVATPTEIPTTSTSEATATEVALGNVTSTIAFQSDRDGNDEIYVMNADGSDQTNLTENPANDAQPSRSQ